MRLNLQWLTAICLAILILATSPQVSKGSDPQLDVLSFDFTPKIVYTRLTSQTITFTTHLTANASGIMDTGPGVPTAAHFLSPSGQIASILFRTPVNLVSGTPQDGIFVSIMTLAQNSEAGIWTLYDFTIVDKDQNQKYLFESDMNARGFPTTFQVSNNLMIFIPLITQSSR